MPTTIRNTDILFNDSSTQNTAATGFGFKNRIINGAMVIDQRNSGASVTPTTDTTYTLDRWVTRLSQASKFAVQQNAGSVTPPTGFTNYLGVTSLSAYSVLTSDFFGVQQNIEGFNIADLGWGASGASPATLSFWVRSSLTGTFSCSLYNQAGSVSIPLTYTISSANTWTYITIAIPASTLAGTFTSTNNGLGISVFWNLGCGSGQSGGTPGTWSGTFARAATGAVSVVGTNGATFYITGVQLEKGSTATSFDYRPYGTEFMLCQRYYYQRGSFTYAGTGAYRAGLSTAETSFLHPVQMRASPSITAGAAAFNVYSTTGAPLTTSVSVVGTDNQYGWISATVSLAVGTQGTGAMFYLASGQTMTITAEI